VTALTSSPRLLASLGWSGFALAIFAFSWLDRLPPGSPFLIASILGSSLLGTSSGVIELSKYIFIGREFTDAMGSSTGIIETFCGAGAGARSWKMDAMLVGV
jgi:hypothetical protein